MLLADARTARVLITVLLFALGLGFLYAARQTLVAFLFAIFFAYLMSPLVSNLEKLLHGRGRAIAVIYVLLLGLVVLFFVSTGPRIARESARLSQSLPALSRLSSGQIAEQLGQEHGWNARLVDLARDYLAGHSDQITRLAQDLSLIHILVLMHLRKKSLPVVSLEESAQGTDEDSQKKDFGADDVALSGSIDRLQLQRAVNDLPPGYRTIFVLHDVEGYEHNEIATLVGCSIGNSKSQLHKARMKLRDLLKICLLYTSRCV